MAGFPVNPIDGQLYTSPNQTEYQYVLASNSWRIVGLLEQGNPGATGVAGVAGATGAGVQGSTGVGAQGSTGTEGVEGATGTQGSTGGQGETGAGIQGVQGTTGSEGALGSTGTQGSTGLRGLIGPEGSTGLQGSEGETGVGTQGTTGAGIQGSTGEQGPTGSKGNDGVTGEQGITGVANFTRGSTFPPSPQDRQLYWDNEDEITYFYDERSDSWIDISSGAIPVAGPAGLDGVTGAEGATGPIAINYAQTVTVAKSGGDYTSVQAAIDSISDASAIKPYTVLIYPGTYTEDITMEAWVSLRGVGDLASTVIAGTNSAPLLAFDGTFSVSIIENIVLDLRPTANAQSVLSVTNGVHQIVGCKLSVISATDDIAANVLDLNGGVVVVRNSNIDYNMDGNSLNARTHSIVTISGTVTYDFTNGCFFNIDIDDVNDEVTLFEEEVGAVVTNGRLLDTVIEIDANNASFTGVISMFDVKGSSPEKSIQNNYVRLRSAGFGEGYAFRLDSSGDTGSINSTANQIRVEGFDKNYSFQIAEGDRFVSHFDDIIADSGATGAGELSLASSTFDGHMSMTDYACQVYDSTGGTDVHTAGGLAVPFDAQTMVDSIYTHSTVTNNSRVYATHAGLYKISYSLGFVTDADARRNVRAYVRKNGSTELTPSMSYDYVRQLANSNGTCTALFYARLEGGDYLELMGEQASTQTGSASAVANASWIMVELIRGLTLN